MKPRNRKIILVVIKLLAQSTSVFLSEEGSAGKIDCEIATKIAPRAARALLLINASPNLKAAHSRSLSHHFISVLENRYPGRYTLSHRDLAVSPVPYIQNESLEVITAGTATNPRAQALSKISDSLIKEIEDSRAIIISTPMHNFTVPASLKAYFDLIIRAGKTFRYTPEGPKGLLLDRPVLLISCSGGYYHGTRSDFLTPYVNQVFNFMGITNLTSIAAEGLAMGDKKEISLTQARGRLEESIEWFHNSESTHEASKN